MSDLKYNFKTIEDISVVESSDGGFLLLEKEGALRRILAKNLTAKSDITVNGISPDENGNIEIKVAAEQVQANMAENDPTKASYIQNRLCYEAPSGEGELMVGGPYAEVRVEEDIPFAMGRHIFSENTQALKPNQTYLVRWMDEDYVCGAMDASAVGKDPEPGFACLGNVRKYFFYALSGSGEFSEEEIELALDALKLAKTEEPFFVVSVEEEGHLVVMNLDSKEMPEIQIFEQDFTVKTLDEKFIPDSIARISDLDWNGLNNKPFGDNTIAIEWDGIITDEMDANKFPVFGEGTDEIAKLCDLPAGFSTAEDLIGCSITFQGETVEITEEIYAGLMAELDHYHNIIPIGDPAIIAFILDTTYSFHMGEEVLEFSAPSPGVYVPGEARHATPVSFIKKTVETLDEQFIPDTIARKNDIDWNNLVNKPFYEITNEEINLEWDGDYESKDMLLINGEPYELDLAAGTIRYYKISDLTPSFEEILTTYIEFNDGTGDYVANQSDYIFGTDELTLVLGVYLVVYNSRYEEEGVVMEATGGPGIYAAGTLDKTIYVSTINYIAEKATITLDEKYIPSSIARVNQIPTISPTSWNDLQDRPFYSEPMEPVDYEDASINIPMNRESGTLTNPPTFIEGAEYIITLNQTDYRVEAVAFKDTNNREYLYLGDGELLGEELGLPHTEVPFLILCASTALVMLVNNSTEDFDYIRIVNASDTLYHKIDPAYLPTGSGSGSGLPEVSEKDEGKILMVKNGMWVITSLVNTEEVSY